MKWKLLLVVIGAVLLAVAGVKVANNASPNDLTVAIATARRSLGRFRARVQHPQPGDKSFFIRARFGSGNQVEYLWLKRVEASGNDFKGVVDQNSLVAAGVQKGATATVPEADVVDWTILREDGKKEGAFTQGLEP